LFEQGEAGVGSGDDQIATSEQAGEPIEWAGHRVSMVAETWRADLRLGPVRADAVYHRPARVEVFGGASVPIRDHVMLARMSAGLAALLRRTP